MRFLTLVAIGALAFTSVAAMPLLPNLVDIPTTQVMIDVKIISVDTSSAKFTIYLPDDIRPGDMITGSALAEPKGRDANETARNVNALKSTGLSTNFNASSSPELDWDEEEDGPYVPRIRPFVFNVPAQPAQIPLQLKIVERGTTLNSIGVPLDLGTPKTPLLSDLPVVGAAFRGIGQQGRPHNARGNFDGNGANTQITVNNSAVQLLAESPRSIVFQSPADAVGPMNVVINDGGRLTQGTYRNIGVNLSAPKLELKKGESTTLTVQVTGLGGIRTDVPIWLVKSGAVAMEGGDYQNYMIRPGDIRSDGTYVTTRKLTGVVAGGFGITATVIDPTWRPLIIPLILDAPVNGYKVQVDGNGGRLVADGVRDPITGKPLDGKHQLDAGCRVPVLSKIPILSTLFKNGGARTEKQECLIFITPRIIVQNENE